MDMIPAMKFATERKTEVRVMAKPVWENRVLNYLVLVVARLSFNVEGG